MSGLHLVQWKNISPTVCINSCGSLHKQNKLVVFIAIPQCIAAWSDRKWAVGAIVGFSTWKGYGNPLQVFFPCKPLVRFDEKLQKCQFIAVIVFSMPLSGMTSIRYLHIQTFSRGKLWRRRTLHLHYISRNNMETGHGARVGFRAALRNSTYNLGIEWREK